MSIKTFFSITALLTAILGLLWLFLPAPMLAMWGADPGDMRLYMSQRYGAMFLGYSAMLFWARKSDLSDARQAITAGGLVVTTVLAFLSLLGILAGTINPSGWIAFGLEALLAIGFGYFLYSNR